MRTSAVSVVAIVLAAGKSSRFGAPKLLQRFGRTTLLGRTLRTVRSSKVDRVVLVLGHRAEEILRGTDTKGVLVVINKEFERGLSSSLRAGLKAVRGDAALIVLADQPFLTASAIDRVIEAYRRTRRPIVAPTYEGVQGNPVLFDKKLFPEVKRVTGDTGARPVILKHADELLRLELRDPRMLFDVDTRGDLREAESLRKTRLSGPTRARNPAGDGPRCGRPS